MTITEYKSRHLFTFFGALFIVVTGAAVFTENYFGVLVPFAALLFYAGWQRRSSLFFLLLATLPFSFEYNFSSGLGTDIPDELLMLLVSVLFFAYFLYTPKSLSKEVKRHPLLFLLILLSGWMLVTVFFSTHQLISAKYLLAKGWYIGAFVLAPLIVLKSKKSIATAFIVLTGSMLLVMIIILCRQFGDGFSFARINIAVSPFFRNHVNYSAMLVCMLPVLVAFLQLSPKRKIKLWLVGALIIVMTALFFSYARGAWLALVAGIIAYWLMNKRLLFYSYIAAIIISVGLFFWFKGNDRYLQYAPDFNTTIFHKNFNEHLIATYQLKDVSTAERFYRWIAGVRMIKDNGLTGYGPNTFYDNYKEYAVPAYKTWVSDNPEHSTVHNYFLLTAIEQGLPGLFFFLLLVGGMFYYAQHLYHRITEPFYKAAAMATGVILTMIMAVNFLSDLIETDKIGSLFFLCFSMLIVTDINSRKESASL